MSRNPAVKMLSYIKSGINDLGLCVCGYGLRAQPVRRRRMKTSLNAMQYKSANDSLVLGGGGPPRSGPWTILPKRYANQIASYLPVAIC
jgi:hypothetical protein